LSEWIFLSGKQDAEGKNLPKSLKALPGELLGFFTNG
jgi:hypothetical protein